MLDVCGSAGRVSTRLFGARVGGLRYCNCKTGKFALSVVRATLHVDGRGMSTRVVGRVLSLNGSLLGVPVRLLPKMRRALQALGRDGHRQLVMTAGKSLLSRRQGLRHSKLTSCFSCMRVVSSGARGRCTGLVGALRMSPRGFVVVNGSLGSSVRPMLTVNKCTMRMPFRIV